MQSSFTALKFFSALSIHFSLPHTLEIDVFTIFMGILFPECHIIGMIQHIAQYIQYYYLALKRNKLMNYDRFRNSNAHLYVKKEHTVWSQLYDFHLFNSHLLFI